MNYFIYKEILRIIEDLAKQGVKEIYLSEIEKELGIEVEDIYVVVGVLEEMGVIKRKFIKNVKEDGSYETILGRELGEHDPNEVYVKYEIEEDFYKKVRG